MPNTTRARIGVGIACAALFAGAAFAVVSLADGGSKGAGTSQSGAGAAKKSHPGGLLKRFPPLRHPPGHPHAPGSRMQGTFPAGIVADAPGPYFHGDTINPLTNGWNVSNHRTLTAVDAGGDGQDKSNGMLGIFRENYLFVTEKEDAVRVVGSGPVTLTKAPEGRGKVQTWAQKRGNLHFTSKSGATGVLHLKNDTVTVNP